MLSWAYNEELNIADYLARASALMDATAKDYEIILIDDGSTDRTYEIAKSVQRQNPRLRIFQNGRNMGSGVSHRVAISKASKEYLFWQTVDWSYDISELRRCLEHLKTYDIVQGVRLGARPEERRLGPVRRFFHIFSTTHLNRRSDNVKKALVSVINYVLVRTLFRVPVSDFQNVTFYPTRWIQSVRFEASSAFANPEGLIKAYWNGMTIKEVPIGFIPRRHGVGKGTRLRAIRAAVLDILRLWFKWVIKGGRGNVSKGRIIRIEDASDPQP
ncbi:MAG TPA: glycosyltransferase family 2 protein [Candidatus Binatia bacterium]